MLILKPLNKIFWMTHPIPSAFTLEPKWRINLKQTAPIVSYKMHQVPLDLLIYTLRMVADWSPFPQLQTDVDTKARSTTLARNNPQDTRFHLLPLQFHVSTSFQTFRLFSWPFTSIITIFGPKNVSRLTRELARTNLQQKITPSESTPRATHIQI